MSLRDTDAVGPPSKTLQKYPGREAAPMYNVQKMCRNVKISTAYIEQSLTGSNATFQI